MRNMIEDSTKWVITAVDPHGDEVKILIGTDESHSAERVVEIFGEVHPELQDLKAHRVLESDAE
jgi:hypothetical protein